LPSSAGLGSILRHDPDVILVGEMRDQETGTMALRAALTGHLVFSTIHTNDAVRSVARLREIHADLHGARGGAASDHAGAALDL
jgi:type II secretory ATPase GspE/PulE/Tfp pilus assembly ATPase PilB-like protein